MRRGLAFVFLVSLLGDGFAGADETWSGVADVQFKGYATLHDFDGTVKGVPLKVSVADGKSGRVVNASSDVRVKQMSTQNDKRDAGMWAMFHEAQHRLIAVEVRPTDERTLRPHDGQPGSMPVTLTIAGKRSTVKGAVTNVVERGDAVSFDLAFPVSLAVFQLEPPKALGGVVSVKDRVDVNAHVTLKRGAR